jgi:CRISPR-associated endoribonuclease Cas6
VPYIRSKREGLMLTTQEIEFTKDDNIKLNLNTGSLMHGALMEFLDTDYAQYLHENSLHPYSQYIYFDKEKDSYVWRISTLNKEAKSQIIDKLQSITQVHLKHNNVTLNVKSNKIIKEISYKDLANEYMQQSNPAKKCSIRFITPTTFKTQGDYIIFPNISNIYYSLLTKWNNFSKEVTLEDKETQNHLINYTKMIGYKLRSTKFQMENVKINSFIGESCYLIKGPLTLVSIANLLFAFAEFSGVGAKTSVGMGGVQNEQ